MLERGGFSFQHAVLFSPPAHNNLITLRRECKGGDNRAQNGPCKHIIRSQMPLNVFILHERLFTRSQMMVGTNIARGGWRLSGSGG